jgi:hypothetical protein
MPNRCRRQNKGRWFYVVNALIYCLHFINHNIAHDKRATFAVVGSARLATDFRAITPSPCHLQPRLAPRPSSRPENRRRLW